MPFNSPLNLPELARTARIATPGRWKQALTPTGNRASISSEGFPYVAENLAPVDADYLETFQPAMVVRLINDLTAATAAADQLRGTLQKALQMMVDGADSSSIESLLVRNMGDINPPSKGTSVAA